MIIFILIVFSFLLFKIAENITRKYYLAHEIGLTDEDLRFIESIDRTIDTEQLSDTLLLYFGDRIDSIKVKSDIYTVELMEGYIDLHYVFNANGSLITKIEFRK